VKTFKTARLCADKGIIPCDAKAVFQEQQYKRHLLQKNAMPLKEAWVLVAICALELSVTLANAEVGVHRRVVFQIDTLVLPPFMTWPVCQRRQSTGMRTLLLSF